MKRFLLVLSFAVAIAFGSGCKQKSLDAKAQEAQAASTIANGKQYPVIGKVISTDPAHGDVTLEAGGDTGIHGSDDHAVQASHTEYPERTASGDRIMATLYVTDSDSLLDQIVVTAQAQPDYKPAMQYHMLNPGDVVPDFKFLDQSGERIGIDNFKGKTLLVTFVYTRCPLPDFCPRMSQNFAKIDKALAADPALYAKTHLLTISFDPEYDTPAVLRSYGGAYTGRYSQERFEHWTFAAPSKADQESVDKFFDIGVTPEKDKTITHSLSTVLVGPDGKVVQWYPTNDWTPDQLLADIKKVEGNT